MVALCSSVRNHKTGKWKVVPDLPLRFNSHLIENTPRLHCNIFDYEKQGRQHQSAQSIYARLPEVLGIIE